MKSRLLLIVLLLGVFPGLLHAQQSVSGQIKEMGSDIPIPGVSIYVKGTNQGTSSDSDGKFSITANSESVLVFSFIGYKTMEMQVGTNTNITVNLESDITELSEVVVMGYTEKDKADLTAAVSVINVAEIGKVTYANALQALQGRVSGVSFTQDGEPGSGRTQVRVRGYTSFNNTSPLLVIDGIPTEEPLDNLNPNDIESIQVLKDASAAIYGSRSAAGVIVVTTKKGKSGKISIDAGSVIGVQTLARKIEVLDASSWGQVYWNASKNSRPNETPAFTSYFNLAGKAAIVPDPQFYDLAIRDQTYKYTAKGTNWADQVYQDALSKQYYLNVSNGSEKGSVMFGTSYFSQDGLIKTTFYDRITARLNSSYKFTDWLEVQENLNVAFSNRLGAASQTDQSGIPMDVIRQHPSLPVFDVDGNYAGRVGSFPDVRNTVSRLEKGKNNTSDSWRIFGNVGASFSVFDAFKILSDQHSLKLRTNFGLDYSNFFSQSFGPKILEGVYQIEDNPYSNAYGDGRTLTFQNIAEYRFENDDHSVKAMAGIESVEYQYRDLSASRTGFVTETPSYVMINSGATITGNGGGRNGWGLYSQFFQLDYGFKDRYLFSGTFRHDETSRFFTDGGFPTFMAGWRISNEKFFENAFNRNLNRLFSEIKIRASWGKLGNQNTGNPYAAYSTFGPQPLNSNYDIDGTNTSVVQGFSIIARGNPQLKWEATTQLNIGLDVAMLQNKLTFTIDAYKKKTTDLLDNPPTILATGEGTAPYLNLAAIENKGIDFSATYLFGKSSADFSMTTSLQATIYRNKILELTDAYPLGYEGERYVDKNGGRVSEGHALSEFYGYINDGIFQNQTEVDEHAAQTGKAIGRLRYRDVNGDGSITVADRTYIGSPHPDISLGLNLAPRYKNFYLDLFFYSMLGQKIFNTTRWVTDFAQNGAYNRRTEILNAWTPENTSATIPMVTIDDRGNDEGKASTYFVEDGSFLKLRTARLGYNIPQKFVRNWRINIYGEVQNAFTLTKYSGVDPEVPQAGLNALGIDAGVYPLPRTFLVGVNFQL